MTIIPVRVDPAIVPHVTNTGFIIEPGHPLYIECCPVCGKPLPDGPVSLVLVGREPDTEMSAWTAAAVAVHDACTGAQR